MQLISEPKASRQAAACLLVVAYLFLSLLFQRATPPLEASDEGAHLIMVAHLHAHRWMPDLRRRDTFPRVSQEMTQPPLYYAIAALWIARYDLADTGRCLVPRPDAPAGRADRPGFKNLWSPAPAAAVAVNGTMAATRHLRHLSMLMGLATVLLVFRMVQHLCPSEPGAAFAGGAWVAFNPMFLFIANSVNNDNLAILLCTAVLLRLVTRPTPGLQSLLLTGLLAGLAVLAKSSALILIPLLVWAGLRDIRSGWAQALTVMLLPLLSAAAVSGWWFLRNHLMYGEWMAFRLHESLIGNGRAAVDPIALFREWDGFLKSYWGVFGGFNVIYPDIAYHGFFLLTALALAAGLVYLLRRRGHPERGPALLGWVAILNLLAVGYWTSRLWGSQGRLLFPSIAAHATWWVLALKDWGPAGRALRTAVSLALFGAAAWAALAVIPAEYPPGARGHDDRPGGSVAATP